MADNYEFDGVNELLSIANQPALQADEKPLYWQPDASGEHDAETAFKFGADFEEVSDHKLIYNETSGTIFGAVTDDYEIINPPEFIGPLCAALKDRDHANVTGNVWVRNGGANAYAQLLFRDKNQIFLPGRGRSNPVRVGFELRWSHDGGISVRAAGFAQDTACTNSIREITSNIHVKHAGDVDARVDWDDEWNHVLDQLGAFSDALAEIIDDAMHDDIWLLSGAESDSELPMSVSDESRFREIADPLNTFEANVSPPGPVDLNDAHWIHGVFESLGFPAYLAGSATKRLMTRLSERDDPRHVTAWDAYSAATYALTHDARGTVGASDERHYRNANDLLMNPPAANADAHSGLRDALVSSDDDQLAEIDIPELAVEDSTGEALRAYSERSRELEASFGGS